MRARNHVVEDERHQEGLDDLHAARRPVVSADDGGSEDENAAQTRVASCPRGRDMGTQSMSSLRATPAWHVIGEVHLDERQERLSRIVRGKQQSSKQPLRYAI
jgi:hypothetical protein